MSHRDTLLTLTYAIGAVGLVCLLGVVMAVLTDGKARNAEQDPPEILPIDDIGYDRGEL